MHAGSDNDAGFRTGRRRASSHSVCSVEVSSRESSSPVPKRQRRAFSPVSDDGDLVAHNEDAETPTPENAPLIRQAVGFSSLNANVATYQAAVDTQPTPSYFLPGQAPPAPPAPPKPKVVKPRAPRKKKGEQYSDRTNRFRLTTFPANTVANSSGPSPPGVTAHSSVRSTLPAATHTSNHSGASADLNDTNRMPVDVMAPLDGGQTSNAPDKNRFVPVNATFSQPGSTSQQHNHGSSMEISGQPNPQVTHSSLPGAASGGISVGQSNTIPVVSQAPPQNPTRPLRMLTLLIEDLRSGVPDPQLAEVRVPLKVADDLEDGFWADAIEVCNALQAGPSRIDGPAKVYTMRGRFRQFFMRVDQHDQLQVQQAHLSVSKERTLTVFVEAPVVQGQLPRPPFQPPDARRDSISEQSSPTPSYVRPTFSLVTREAQIERLSKSSYAKPPRKRSPVSEGGSYGHSRRTPSKAQHGSPQQDHGLSQRSLSPPIPGRLADTEEEKNEAIANYIRSHIENHNGWMDYMQSKAKPQRVSEVLRQYNFVEDRVRELAGLKTPAHWDGAPNCHVEKEHVWRVLKLDDKWGKKCEETLDLVGYYGENGSRYEDSRVVDMINDTSPPEASTMQQFLRLLRDIDENFMRDAASAQFPPLPPQRRTIVIDEN